MADYRLTNKAVVDLNEIWDYTFDEWSEEQADIYYEVLLGSCQEIARHPEIGKHYDGISPEVYGLKTNRHIIFYRKIEDDSVEIIRILHEKNGFKEQSKRVEILIRRLSFC
ncbi:MAG: type II toxin-antitoxin system RelE/ParE family toxin [Balneolaceae bacterium]|nr:type II toxin-antitoxin system RelE/ParE family toxin [Balneolaceae bacterium]MCH8550010.1 type II toxin-antitoxin system RelE/ParE family toxin [Balneolaceae bacterium]